MPSLTSGGAERIMSFISRELNRQKFEVLFVVIGNAKDTKYDTTGINVCYLNKSRVLYGIWSIFKILREQQFDVTITSIRYMNTLMGYLARLFPKTRFIGREASVISKQNLYLNSSDRKYPYFIYKYSYKGLDQIVCQSNDMLDDLIKEFPKLKSKFIVINNPITTGFIPKKVKTKASKPIKLITVGSLISVKGHLRILEGLKSIKDDFQYTLIGKGPQLKSIMTKAEELGLKDKIIHLPFTKKVKKHLVESHCFIQGSYVEGFPNALLESCAVGTPVIAFNASGGTKEIVEHGLNGLLIERPSEIPKALESILKPGYYNPDQVSESVTRKFDSSVIISRYEQLFTYWGNQRLENQKN